MPIPLELLIILDAAFERHTKRNNRVNPISDSQTYSPRDTFHTFWIALQSLSDAYPNLLQNPVEGLVASQVLWHY